MGMSLVTVSLNSIAGFQAWDYFSEGSALIGACVGAVVGLSMAGNSNVPGHTDKLWELISQKEKLINVVKPKYRHLYQDDLTKVHLEVSTFGNIQFSKEKGFSFRKQGYFEAQE
jgi:hypothetical protein